MITKETEGCIRLVLSALGWLFKTILAAYIMRAVFFAH